MKKHILTIAIAISLSACGSSSDDNSNGGGSEGDGIFNPPTGELAQKMKAVSVKDSQVDLLANCGTTGTTFETEDLVIGYFKEALTQRYDADLFYAAQLSQVGLDELVEFGRFDKATDLGLDGQNKWFVCFDNSKTGNGTGFVGGLEFSPTAFDQYGLHLAKHELFHTIQSRFLNDEYGYLHLPFWFQEASAEFFAYDGQHPNVTGSFMQTFLADVYKESNISAKTPTAIETWNTDQQIRQHLPEYQNSLYKIYTTALNYLVAKDLTQDNIIELTRNSYLAGQNFETRPQFHSAIQALEADGELNLPSGYEYLDLKVSETFKELVVDDWLGGAEYTASFTSVSPDIEIGHLFLIPLTDKGDDYSIPVASNQQSYSYISGSVLNGAYELYAIDTLDTHVYGPITQSVVNGELGDVDFTGVGECTTCDDD